MEEILTKLKRSGVDVNCVVSKLGGNEALYITICKKFLQDSNFRQFQEGMYLNDCKQAITYIHTLKGVAANLGFVRMEGICSEIIGRLRMKDKNGLDQYNKELSKEYNNIVSIISNY